MRTWPVIWLDRARTESFNLLHNLKQVDVKGDPDDLEAIRAAMVLIGKEINRIGELK